MEGFTDKIIMVRIYTGTLEFEIEHRFFAKAETERFKLIKFDLVVPKEAVIILPSINWSTRDEVLAVYDYIANKKHIKSIILSV